MIFVLFDRGNVKWEFHCTNLVNHVVGKILIKIGKWIRILTQGLILTTEAIPGSNLSESNKIDNIECTNVVRLASKVILPISTLPESEPFHVCVRVAKRGVTIRGSSQIQITKFFQIRPDKRNFKYLKFLFTCFELLFKPVFRVHLVGLRQLLMGSPIL